MLKILCCLILGCSAMVAPGPLPRSANNGDSGTETQPGVRYTVLSQRWLRKDELSQFKDVHGLTLAVRMRLSNESMSPVFYLAGTSVIPQGYKLFRKIGETSWQYLPKSRGREGSPGSEFSGVAYTWLELPAGASIEFETYDWSAKDEEHAFSAFIREDKNAVSQEVTSDTYRPITSRQL
jgi:hypothetical protein